MMTEAPKDYVLIENYQPTQWEWTDDLSKFRKDGWNYMKEWPGGRVLIGRPLTISRGIGWGGEVG